MHNVNANGAEIPALGFGTFRMDDAEVAAVLPEALKLGFRHVDTAQVYGNEAAVGAAIKAAGVARDEIFLTTKVWVTEFAEADFLPSVEESLKKLGVDHVDLLLLLHWPHGNDTPREVQIAELNKTVAKGMVRHIGVSNYNVAEMHEAAKLSDAPLVTNQVEYHPYLSQAPILKACEELGMVLTGYYGMADGLVPQDEVLKDIGSAHGKTAAQVALRWLVQQPRVVTLSKTAKLERLPENFGIFDFELSDAQMEAIHGLARPDGRIISPEDMSPEWD
ncbi:2,5-didehydrogluconate reductase [Thioclava sp. SK-1]|uniref:aldo/keto reductase n=1 Tax=Thioclava sp. SK-1 TaxID=1889770 RepID=UPI0008240791|nr:aldo/keto reductase [Thioclava sp. SK-1]OCX65713.1 2,5-didehydrogluconate reductase [Thioclava sp. SK-1]